MSFDINDNVVCIKTNNTSTHSSKLTSFEILLDGTPLIFA